MNGGKVSEVQVKGANKQVNPVVKTDRANEEIELGKDKKPPAARSSRGLRPGSSKRCSRAKSVGGVTAMNALRTKEKQRDGDRFRRSLLSRGFKKNSKEPVEKELSETDVSQNGGNILGNLADLPDTDHIVVLTNMSEAVAPSISSDMNHHYITECANTWAAIGFVLTTSHAGIYAAFAVSGDLIYRDFYAWVTKPVSLTALFISFSLKPRREDFFYKFVLYFQWSIFCICTEVSIIPTKLDLLKLD